MKSSRSSERKRTCFDESVVDQEAFRRDFKRIRQQQSEKNDPPPEPDIKPVDHFPSTKDAFEYLRGLCRETLLFKSRGLAVPVVWKHHLHALISNVTKVDQELNQLTKLNQIRVLSVDQIGNNKIIVHLEDLCQFYQKDEDLLVKLFVARVLRPFSKTTYSVEELADCGLTPEAIQKLIHLGLLTLADHHLHHRQLSFSGIGTYVKCLELGRKSLLSYISKCKYSQISQNELLKRVIPKCNGGNFPCLGIELHLYDLFGSRLVSRDSLAGGDFLIRQITN